METEFEEIRRLSRYRFALAPGEDKITLADVRGCPLCTLDIHDDDQGRFVVIGGRRHYADADGQVDVALNPREMLTLMGEDPAHHDLPMAEFDERETTNMVLEVWMRIIF